MPNPELVIVADEKLPRLNMYDPDWAERVRITLACRDADGLPRVPNAGKFADLNGTAIQVMHNGTVVVRDCYHGPHSHMLMHYLRGVHEPQEEKCFHEILKYIPKEGVMIELGAFWGYYSLWFWKQIAEAKCHLIEPDAANLAVGMRNFQLNGAVGIFTHAGLGRRNLSTASIPPSTRVEGNYLRMPPSGQFFGPDAGGSHRIRRNVPVLDVSDYIRDNAIPHVDILHCDIQGAELGVLEDLAAMPRPIPISFLVFSTHISDEFHATCLQKVKEIGYHVMAEHNVCDSYSGDGLIVARRPDIEGPERIEISLRSQSIY